jgi:amidase
MWFLVPLLEQFDTPGPMAKTVTDAAVTLDEMVGVDPRDPVTRSQRGHVPRSYLQFLRPGASK